MKRWAFTMLGPGAGVGAALALGAADLAIAYTVGGSAAAFGAWVHLRPTDLSHGPPTEHSGVVEPLPEGYALNVIETGNDYSATVRRIPTEAEQEADHRMRLNGFTFGVYDRYRVSDARGATADGAAQAAIRRFHRDRERRAACEIAEMVHNPSGANR